MGINIELFKQSEIENIDIMDLIMDNYIGFVREKEGRVFRFIDNSAIRVTYKDENEILIL
jgi:hypothetical protein